MTENQVFEVHKLKQSCEQAEDALSQGMEKLQETLAKTVAASHLVEGTHIPQMGTAVEMLEALVSYAYEVHTKCFYSKFWLSMWLIFMLLSFCISLSFKYLLSIKTHQVVHLSIYITMNSL